MNIITDLEQSLIPAAFSWNKSLYEEKVPTGQQFCHMQKKFSVLFLRKAYIGFWQLYSCGKRAFPVLYITEICGGWNEISNQKPENEVFCGKDGILWYMAMENYCRFFT